MPGEESDSLQGIDSHESGYGQSAVEAGGREVMGVSLYESMVTVEAGMVLLIGDIRSFRQRLSRDAPHWWHWSHELHWGLKAPFFVIWGPALWGDALNAEETKIPRGQEYIPRLSCQSGTWVRGIPTDLGQYEVIGPVNQVVFFLELGMEGRGPVGPL